VTKLRAFMVLLSFSTRMLSIDYLDTGHVRFLRPGLKSEGGRDY